MKKLIVITTILIALLCVAVSESVLSTIFYDEMKTELIAVNEFLSSGEENKESALDGVERILSEWNKHKNFVMMFANHATVRSIEEKLVALRSYLSDDGFDDARAYTEMLIALAEDMRDDTHLSWSNIF